MNVVPLGPDAGADGAAGAARPTRSSCLLCDRDIGGGGVEVEFFGERTTLPGGPGHARAAHRRAAAARRPSTSDGRRPPRRRAPAARRRARRAGCATTSPASPRTWPTSSRRSIRRAPEQWHLLQPNWPSDRGWPSASRSRRRRGAVPWRPMRIGLVCPYSLTVPGGVQGQVLGLARSLRASGHDARVLGPCDGPPPDAGVTPLGSSHPDRRQRLGGADRARPVGPAAHHPGPARRGASTCPPARAARARARRMTAILFTQRAAGRHVPRRRRQRGVPVPRPGRALAGAPPRPALRGVGGRRGAGARRASAASTSCCSTASRSSGSPRPTPWPDRRARRSSSSAATSPARASTCCSTRCATLPADVRLWVGGDGPETGDAASAARRRPPHRVARPHLRRREGGAGCAAPTCSAPVAAGRVVRRGAARGHGRRDAGRGQRPRRATATWPAPARRAARAARRRRRPWPPRSRSVLDEPVVRRGAGGLGPAAGRGVLDGQPGRALRRAVPNLGVRSR